jgi:hypothetical protein
MNKPYIKFSVGLGLMFVVAVVVNLILTATFFAAIKLVAVTLLFAILWRVLRLR